MFRSIVDKAAGTAFTHIEIGRFAGQSSYVAQGTKLRWRHDGVAAPEQKIKRRRRCLRFASPVGKTLTEPSGGMREQGVDQARLGGEVTAQRLRSPVLARDFVEQAFELGDIAVDR